MSVEPWKHTAIAECMPARQAYGTDHDLVADGAGQLILGIPRFWDGFHYSRSFQDGRIASCCSSEQCGSR